MGPGACNARGVFFKAPGLPPRNDVMWAKAPAMRV